MSPLTQADVAQALSHLLRQRLLLTFMAHRPLSPKEASDILDVPLADVSYHVMVLADYGFLVLRAKAQVRGAFKSYYLPNDEVLDSAVVREFLAENPSMGIE